MREFFDLMVATVIAMIGGVAACVLVIVLVGAVIAIPLAMVLWVFRFFGY